jgi:hypothetical protein
MMWLQSSSWAQTSHRFSATTCFFTRLERHWILSWTRSQAKNCTLGCALFSHTNSAKGQGEASVVAYSLD